MKTVTKKAPSDASIQDLIFANKIVKHTKSNTIVFVKDNVLIASGVGQTSRVDALKQAVVKAEAFGFTLKDAVMASDAFFPFPDCVELAADAGIIAVLQPGGSIKDQDSIDEIILATNPNTEGEATAMYIKKQLVEKLNGNAERMTITRLAYGLPIGAELEFADYMTLKRSLEGRKDF